MAEEAILKHVFISYSRKDTPFVNRLIANLEQAGISVWIDNHDIRNDVRNFEREIRKALKASFVVILIASPSALESEYVQGELDIVRERDIPLLILWIDGQYYTDCVPLFLTRRSFIDCRGEKYEEQIPRIVSELATIRDAKLPSILEVDIDERPPRSHISIRLHERNRQIWIRPTAFTLMHDFLNSLYVFCLEGVYPPYTYGSRWVLSSHYAHVTDTRLDVQSITRLALPFSWLLKPAKEMSMSAFDHTWLDAAPAAYGIVPNTYWEILDCDKYMGVGLVTNDQQLAETVERLAHLDNRQSIFSIDKLLMWEKPSSTFSIDALLAEEAPNSTKISKFSNYQWQYVLAATMDSDFEHYSGKVVVK
ncbi:MAG: toll/interleukin-1 receptor domain-containing protein [Anaerolineae bacterium]|nr:toll/interleukin-1 receptor domain-containing protein [Anaerolineae bacterium]